MLEIQKIKKMSSSPIVLLELHFNQTHLCHFVLDFLLWILWRHC